MSTPGSISFGNYTFTLGTCTYQLNNGAATNCGYDDTNLTVTTTKNSITLNYVNSYWYGSALLSQATASGCTCIQFEVTVSNSAGISQALVSSTGYGQTGNTLNNWVETYGTSTKLANAAITTNGYQTATGSYDPAGNPTSMNLELGLGVNGAYDAGVLSLSSASITFITAPEPATITIMLTGIAGLLFVRSRGRRGRNGPPPMGYGHAMARMG